MRRVIAEHKASFDYTMVAAKGDKVHVGREDPETPGWFWCRNAAGVEMWAPSTHLNIRGDEGVFTRDYDSVELDAAVGDVVHCVGEALGWAECIDGDGEYGWIPLNKLAHTS